MLKLQYIVNHCSLLIDVVLTVFVYSILPRASSTLCALALPLAWAHLAASLRTGTYIQLRGIAGVSRRPASHPASQTQSARPRAARIRMSGSGDRDRQATAAAPVPVPVL